MLLLTPTRSATPAPPAASPRAAPAPRGRARTDSAAVGRLLARRADALAATSVGGRCTRSSRASWLRATGLGAVALLPVAQHRAVLGGGGALVEAPEAQAHRHLPRLAGGQQRQRHPRVRLAGGGVVGEAAALRGRALRGALLRLQRGLRLRELLRVQLRLQPRVVHQLHQPREPRARPPGRLGRQRLRLREQRPGVLLLAGAQLLAQELQLLLGAQQQRVVPGVQRAQALLERARLGARDDEPGQRLARARQQGEPGGVHPGARQVGGQGLERSGWLHAGVLTLPTARQPLGQKREARCPEGYRASQTSQPVRSGLNVLRWGGRSAPADPWGPVDIELHLLALSQGAEALGLDGGVVAEHVLAPAVLSDEAEALRVVEPLHGTSCHFASLSSGARPRAAPSLRPSAHRRSNTLLVRPVGGSRATSRRFSIF